MTDGTSAYRYSASDLETIRACMDDLQRNADHSEAFASTLNTIWRMDGIQVDIMSGAVRITGGGTVMVGRGDTLSDALWTALSGVMSIMDKTNSHAQLCLKHNNTGTKSECPLCGGVVDALVGLEVFVEGTWEPVCDQCIETHAPELAPYRGMGDDWQGGTPNETPL